MNKVMVEKCECIKQEAHCFNIAKTKSGYALLDYSVPSKVYNQDGTLRRYNPFLGELTEEEFLDFVSNGTVKTFDNYCIKNGQKEKDGTQRMYVVGQSIIEKKSPVANTY